MAAYVISEVEVLDEELANQYRPLAAASIAEYGGRYVVRGAEPAILEGEPTRAQDRYRRVSFCRSAREWYGSASYAKALAIRGKALDRRLMLVEGPPPGSST